MAQVTERDAAGYTGLQMMWWLLWSLIMCGQPHPDHVLAALDERRRLLERKGLGDYA